jgi:uncharacterized membrane protein (TIGR01666 family)
MHKHIASFRDFMYTQYFYDGIKITIGVLLPSLIFFQFNQLSVGIAISLGSLCVSIADNPGPNLHKRNAMVLTACLIFVVSIITGLVSKNTYLLGIEIFLLSFLFSMFHLYGDRAAAVGTATLLIMILSIDAIRPYSLLHALYILSGGVWYMLLSMLFVQIRPYRYAQQSLGESIIEIAKYLKTKSLFYGDSKNVNDIFKSLVEQQVIVNEQQEKVREILFKSGKLQKDYTPESRLLVLIFIDMVDLFEQTMATHYDYDEVRNQYKNLKILPQFRKLIVRLSSELDYLGACLMYNEKPNKHLMTLKELDLVNSRLDVLEAQGVNVLVLKKILINIQNIFVRVDDIYKYYKIPHQNLIDKAREADLGKFVNHQDYNFGLFKNNFTFQSSYFRHGLRVALVSLFGFVVGKLLPVGHHSYWILLTILVILKPGFSLTKKRNYERVVGTVIGGIAGGLILYFIKDQTLRFAILLVFMVLTYSFQRIKYVVSVLFMTPFILILFSFISPDSNINVATERIIDTLIGSVIAFLSSYLLFPSWESFNFKKVLSSMVQANLNYFSVIASKLSGEDIPSTQYKLARKEVYVSTANLGAAFQRMLNEPKNKQHKTNEVQKFVILNHILTSYLANLSISINNGRMGINAEQMNSINQSIFYLKESVLLFNATYKIELNNIKLSSSDNLIVTTDNQLQTDQLNQILKISSDVFKITEKL